MSGGGDYTRFTFDPADDHAAVFMQQGRVMLDADFNELAEIVDRRMRAETIDVIGRCTVPRETPDGFRIDLSGSVLTIGPGRLYADGLLAENRGADPAAYDAALGEVRGSQPVAYEDQPYLPDAATLAPLPDGGGPYLAYLDVWRREVSYLAEPDLLERAVGVDTTTRLQTVWQVRLFDPWGDGVPGRLDCDTPDDTIPGWADLVAPSAGRLTTAAAGVPEDDDPCTIPPSGGYRGTENRLYRVEVHDPGPVGTATIKWSRDNGSVATAVVGLNVAGDVLTVVRTGRDSLLRFSAGDWVEVTDDRLELHGLPGVMRKVDSVDDVAETITLTAALPPGTFDPTDAARHTRVVRWDQRGLVRDPNGVVVADVDAAGGVIPVPAPAALPVTFVLEDGVQVTFSSDPAGGRMRTGDHWSFAARVADASVEVLDEAPPRGVLHHYCRLAVVTFPDEAVDCRTLWPPEVAGAGCDCSVCVTPESHASGALTIQRAVDEVRTSGGRVCLAPGTYRLGDTVTIGGARSVTLHGAGWRTVLIHAGSGPAIAIDGSAGITLEEMSILTAAVAPERDVGGGLIAATGMGVLVRNSAGVTVQRCVVLQIGRLRGQNDVGTAPAGPLAFLGAGGPAIALTGFVVECVLRENALAGGAGIVAVASGAQKVPGLEVSGFRAAAVANLLVEDNVILAASLGVGIDGLVLSLLETRLAGNTLLYCRAAAVLARGRTLADASPSHVAIRQNTVWAAGHGIVVGSDASTVEANEVAGFGRETKGAGDGIALVPTEFTGEMERVRVAGNRVAKVGGSGIALRGRIASAVVTGNVVEEAGGGIVMADGSDAGDLVVDANLVLEVAGDAAERAFVSGIRVVGAERVRVTGNTVRGVGRRAPAASGRNGILVVGSPSATIAGNEVSQIAPEEKFAGEAAGIEIVGPFERADVAGNAVRRAGEAAGPDTSEWWGVRVRPAPPAGTGTVIGTLGVVAVKAAVFLVSAERVVRLRRGRETVGVRGNLAQAYGLSPAVEVAAGGACTLSDNRCLLSSDKAQAVVRVAGGAAIAGGNYVEGPPEVPAIVLEVPAGPFTVLGNVTSGPIRAPTAGTPLGPPWQDLNVVAP